MTVSATYPRVGTCDQCGGAEVATSRSVVDGAGRWSVARCDTCGVDVTYRRNEHQTLVVPGLAVIADVDVDAEIVAVTWRAGSTWGVRCLHLLDGYLVDISSVDPAPIDVRAVGDGAIAVTLGVSRYAEPTGSMRPPDGHPALVDLATGAVRDVESIDAFVARQVQRRAERPSVPRYEIAVEGSPAFEHWGAIALVLTGRTPIMKLRALHHEGHDVIGFFADPDDDGREHLLVARGDEVRWHRRPTLSASTTTELVGGAWDPVGFRVEGRWLISGTGSDRVELFPLVR